MESDLQNLNQNQLQQSNSRLTRYRSAPSSYFANFIEENVSDEFFPRRPLSPETEQIFARFLSAGTGTGDLPELNPGENLSHDYSSVPQSFYPNHIRPPLPNSTPVKIGAGNSSNLLRQASSPAGLFSDLLIQNGLLTPISENETNFPIDSWDDSDNITAENQTGEAVVPRPPLLAHHLSLPNTCAEISAIEKLLKFPDSVPCKIRAKRGFATHPRSIAERVRRTRISERMRKLQELVPNMEKQTNTSDMLDLAVDYIKDLQQHVQTLSDKRAKCTCSNRQPL